MQDLPMHGKAFSQSLLVLAENRMRADRLVKWIGQQALKRTFTLLADETGVVEESLLRKDLFDLITRGIAAGGVV